MVFSYDAQGRPFAVKYSANNGGSYITYFHTYYVSDNGVLVHNSCNHNSAWNKERRNYWKNTAKSAVKGQDYGAYVATEKIISRMALGKAPIG